MACSVPIPFAAPTMPIVWPCDLVEYSYTSSLLVTFDKGRFFPWPSFSPLYSTVLEVGPRRAFERPLEKEGGETLQFLAPSFCCRHFLQPAKGERRDGEASPHLQINVPLKPSCELQWKLRTHDEQIKCELNWPIL